MGFVEDLEFCVLETKKDGFAVIASVLFGRFKPLS